MSKILINTENYKKNSKRLQKALQEYGFEVNLSDAQNILAKSFGVKNTFDMLNFLNDTNTNENCNHINEEDFIFTLITILKDSKSIKKCLLYTDYGNFIIDIVSNNEESYGIYFGATDHPKIKDLINIGISEETSLKLISLFSKIPEDKYEGLLFGSKIFKKYCNDKKIHYFKNDLFEFETILNSKVYKKRYTLFNKNIFDSQIIGFDNSMNLMEIKSGKHPGFEEIIELKIYLKNKEQYLVEYYIEQYSENPKCYAIKYWYIDENSKIQEKQLK